MASVSELQGSIQSVALKVLIWQHQCQQLAQRAQRIADENVLDVLRTIESFFITLQNRRDLLDLWLSSDTSQIFEKYNKLLDPFDSVDSIAEVEIDHFELSSVVSDYTQEFSALQVNESRRLNEEMMENLDLVDSIKKNNANKLKLKVFNRDFLDYTSLNRQSLIGVGQFSEIYLAKFKRKNVAVKRIKTGDGAEFDRYCAHFLVSAQNLQLYSFPGVIRIFGVDNEENPSMIMMELAECSLYSALYEKKKKKSFTYNQKVTMLHSICLTLSFLHSIGFIHRVVSSSNCLLMPDGSIKLTALTWSKTNWNDTSGELVGFYAYMAPELVLQDDSPYVYSEATDVYAFGILMNELMTGEKPYNDLDHSNNRLIMTNMFKSDGKLRPTPYAGEFQADLIPIISKCWSQPTERPTFFQLSFLLKKLISPSISESKISADESIYVENIFLASDISGYYTGEMVGNMKHGQGVVRRLDNVRYQGEWVCNELVGFKVEDIPDFSYGGSYVNFIRKGNNQIEEEVSDGEEEDLDDNIFNTVDLAIHDTEELLSLIQFEALKVLAWKAQCRLLVERIVGIPASVHFDKEYTSLLHEVYSFFVQLQSKHLILEHWIKCKNAKFVDLNSRLDNFTTVAIPLSQADIDSDESELQTFVLRNIQEYRSLRLNESRTFNDEMMANLNFVLNFQKGIGKKVLLREFSQDALVANKSEVLGSGAFGTVLKGTYQGIDVAVKEVNLTTDEDKFKIYCAELVNEARILQVHSFPGIIRMFGVDDKRKPTQIIMERAKCSLYIALHSKNNKMQFSDDEKIEMLLCLCSTFAFLHSIGIVHRDIKSRNILVMSDNTVKVADFGSSNAKVIMEKGDDMRGTYAYVAPELLRQEIRCLPHVYNEATDMYSFGVLMNELMTNEEPHKGHSNTMIFLKCLHHTFSKPQLYSGAMQGIGPIIESCWNDDPEKRGTFFLLYRKIRPCLSSSMTAITAGDDKPAYVENVFLASDISGYYTGEMVGNMKHGQGVVRRLDMVQHKGQWVNNQLKDQVIDK